MLADDDTMSHIDVGIDATVQRPTKLSPLAPIIGPDYPWEGTMHFYGSVVTLAPNDHCIYYACNVQGKKQGAADDQSSCCVAVSTDGTTWTKPLLPYCQVGVGDSASPLNLLYRGYLHLGNRVSVGHSCIHLDCRWLISKFPTCTSF